MTKLRGLGFLLVLPVLLPVVGCELSKSSNPLSPSVAGPIPGVNISAPRPIEPSAGAKVAVDQQPITLTVENATTSGARPLSYSFEVATDADFKSKVFVRDGIAPGSGRTSLRLPDPLATGRSYYWRARAEDGANTGPYSGPMTFNLFTPVVIAQPRPIEPINNVVTSNLHPHFSFFNAPRTGPAGAMAYVIEVSSTDSFARKLAIWIVAEQLNQTDFDSPQDFAYSTQYFWRVQAYDPTTTGPWSATQVFQTPAPVIAPPPPDDGGGDDGGGDDGGGDDGGGDDGGGGSPGSCAGNNGPTIVHCIEAKYPDRVAAGVSSNQRVANMDFLRDRIIEAGICGGMDLAWNNKRNSGQKTHDGLVWRHGGRDDFVDIGYDYDNTSQPLRLVWAISVFPYYWAYTPRPTCQ